MLISFFLSFLSGLVTVCKWAKVLLSKNQRFQPCLSWLQACTRDKSQQFSSFAVFPAPFVPLQKEKEEEIENPVQHDYDWLWFWKIKPMEHIYKFRPKSISNRSESGSSMEKLWDIHECHFFWFCCNSNLDINVSYHGHLWTSVQARSFLFFTCKYGQWFSWLQSNRETWQTSSKSLFHRVLE